MFVINLKEAQEVIKGYIDSRLPVMIWGKPGIGKSSIIHQIGKEQNRKVQDIRLSQIEFSDLRGIPYIVNEKVLWSIPSFFPTDENDNSILFFDEINLAHPSIMNAAYQLILDRKIGDYTLPKNVSVIAAGNKSSDSDNIVSMPYPLLNRFAHIEVKSDFTVWKKYATEVKIHPLVIDYLTQYNGDLNISSYQGVEESFQTPRSWEFVSKILYKRELNVLTANDKETLKIMFSGCIGEALGVKFLRFIVDKSKLVNFDINNVFKLSGYVVKDFIVTPQYLGSILKYISVNEVSSKEFDTSIDFVRRHADDEVVISYITSLVQNKNLKITKTMYPKAYEIIEKLHKENPNLATYLESNIKI